MSGFDRLLCVVCGIEHNGTTFVANTIYSHPKIFSGFETGLLLKKNFNECKPYNKWIHKPGFHWGVEQSVEFDRITSFDEKFMRLFESKGSFHQNCNIQKEIHRSEYIVDKTPEYVYNLSYIRNNTPVDIPIIVVLKNFVNNYKSYVMKRKIPIWDLLRRVNNCYKSLQYVSRHRPKNVHVLSHEDIVKHPYMYEQFITMVINQRLDPADQFTFKSDKFLDKAKKMGITSSGAYELNSFTPESTVDVKLPRVSHLPALKIRYDHAISTLKTNLGYAPAM